MPNQITLIEPPFVQYLRPQLALPLLSASLKQAGFYVDVIDLNNLEANRTLQSRWSVFQAYCKYWCGKTFLNLSKDGGKKFYDFDSWMDLKNNLHTLSEKQLGYYFITIDRFLNEEYVAQNKLADEKYVISVLEKHRASAIYKEAPKIVGISISLESQLIFATSLIKLIKEFSPLTTVVVGGGYLNGIGQSNPKLVSSLLDIADYLTSGPGEVAITMLSEHILQRKHLKAEIPGLIWKSSPTIISGNGSAHNQPRDNLPCPDFSHIKSDTYFTPELLIPYQVTNACWWGRCSFCAGKAAKEHISTLSGDKVPYFREKSVDIVIDDLRTLYEQGFKNISFVDDSLHPEYFIELVTKLSKTAFAKDLGWTTLMKHSHLFTDDIAQKAYRAGMRSVLFGTETLNPRLMKLLQKGVTVETARKNIKSFSKAKIGVLCFFLAGIPSETIEELEQEILDVKELLESGQITQAFFNKVYITKDSYFQVFPTKYGITKIYSPDSNGTMKFESESEDGVLIKQNTLVEMCKEMDKLITTQAMCSEQSWCFWKHKYSRIGDSNAYKN